jgi:predicted Zn-dependent protease
VTKVATTAGVLTGTLSGQQADSINKGTEAVGKALEKFTPENEYYIGRAVGASILEQYPPLNSDSATRYLNLLGQSLAAVSDKPETFAGYHFLILDTDDVNAFAAPGGLILVSRGLIRCCKDEDSLAAVVAHEIGHVQNEDALNAISKSRKTNALTVLGAEAAKNVAGGGAQLVSAFEGCVSDVVKQMVDNGYSRGCETKADASAVSIMSRLGYNPRALEVMLEEMDKRVQKGDKKGFGKTHPAPKDRIKAVDPLVASSGPMEISAARQARFDKAMGGI